MVLLIILLLPSLAFASDYPERVYQEAWCAKNGGITEVVLSGGSRVDCLTETHAVEVEFAPKWKEAIGV